MSKEKSIKNHSSNNNKKSNSKETITTTNNNEQGKIMKNNVEETDEEHEILSRNNSINANSTTALSQSSNSPFNSNVGTINTTSLNEQEQFLEDENELISQPPPPPKQPKSLNNIKTTSSTPPTPNATNKRVASLVNLNQSEDSSGESVGTPVSDQWTSTDEKFGVLSPIPKNATKSLLRMSSKFDLPPMSSKFDLPPSNSSFWTSDSSNLPMLDSRTFSKTSLFVSEHEQNNLLSALTKITTENPVAVAQSTTTQNPMQQPTNNNNKIPSPNTLVSPEDFKDRSLHASSTFIPNQNQNNQKMEQQPTTTTNTISKQQQWVNNASRNTSVQSIGDYPSVPSYSGSNNQLPFDAPSLLSDGDDSDHNLEFSPPPSPILVNENNSIGQNNSRDSVWLERSTTNKSSSHHQNPNNVILQSVQTHPIIHQPPTQVLPAPNNNSNNNLSNLSTSSTTTNSISNVAAIINNINNNSNNVNNSTLQYVHNPMIIQAPQPIISNVNNNNNLISNSNLINNNNSVNPLTTPSTSSSNISIPIRQTPPISASNAQKGQNINAPADNSTQIRGMMQQSNMDLQRRTLLILRQKYRSTSSLSTVPHSPLRIPESERTQNLLLPLSSLLATNQTDVVRKTLREQLDNPQTRRRLFLYVDNNGRSLLHLMVTCSMYDDMGVLLKARAEALQQQQQQQSDKESGRSPPGSPSTERFESSHRRGSSGFASLYKALDINHKDLRGWTPLTLAVNT